MGTIHKQPLTEAVGPDDFIEVGGTPIHAGLDPNEVPCVWYETSTTATTRVYVFGTGFVLPENVRHLTSFVQGVFVWHVYTS